ncbi:MAG: site-2 protease family protein [Verrucomicrobia bacterium]|nr:site-2 protease family protein [Verrucomicrobiota bacterium]
MAYELLQSLLSNVWSIFLVVLFFGGSIFVHELGHFLAARRRGAVVERFSIGFGPAIWSWRGRDGVEYRIAWFPLGGYVLLPQLADLGAIEGESTADVSKLPPVSYATKMIVFVAGAAFNVAFAFVLACLVWAMGQPISSDMVSTRIGYVARTLDLPDGTKVPSPAAQAGLQIGDLIRRIDGSPVENWSDIQNSLVLGSGRTASGERQVTFSIERNGQPLEIQVSPRLAGEEKIRRVGIGPGFELIVQAVPPGSLGERAGFKVDDEILTFDGQIIINDSTYRQHLETHANRAIAVTVRRHGQTVALTIPPRPESRNGPPLGLALRTGYKIIHVSPFEQIADVARWTVRTLHSLISPSSDIGLNKMSGPVGIVRILHTAAEVGLRAVLMITILLNVNLAIFKLLPLPVLDGGQMLFATLARLRGKALPVNVIMTAQSVFFVLLLSMVAYVTIFSDVPRIVRDYKADRAAETKAAPPPSTPPPAPAK